MQFNRLIFFVIFISCISLLGFGLYLEHFKGIEPCPLCIFQRIAYIAIAIISLMAAIYLPGKKSFYLYATLLITSALSGAGIAGRQIWLQHLPADKVPECGPGLDYLLEVFPLTETLKMVFTGSGECAEVHWRFAGLSIAEWSMVCFILIFCGVIYNIFFYHKKRNII